jgi:hypothetical protein
VLVGKVAASTFEYGIAEKHLFLCSRFLSVVLGCVIRNRLARKHPPLGGLDRLMFQSLHPLYTIGLSGGFLGHGRVKVLASSKNIYFPEPLAFWALRRSRFRKICF